MTPRGVRTTTTPRSLGQSHLGITAGGLLPENMTEEREQHVLKADSPEECDAWDVWVEELKTVRQLLLDVWNSEVRPSRSSLRATSERSPGPRTAHDSPSINKPGGSHEQSAH